MSLLQFGPFTFEMRALAPHKTGSRREWRWSDTERLSGENALQHLGRGPADFSLEATLFPERYGAHSTAQLTLLEAIGDQGQPQPLIRGDLSFVGWYAIVSLEAGDSYIDRRGRGRMVEVSAEFRRFGADGPGPSVGGASLVSVFDLAVGL